MPSKWAVDLKKKIIDQQLKLFLHIFLMFIFAKYMHNIIEASLLLIGLHGNINIHIHASWLPPIRPTNPSHDQINILYILLFFFLFFLKSLVYVICIAASPHALISLTILWALNKDKRRCMQERLKNSKGQWPELVAGRPSPLAAKSKQDVYFVSIDWQSLFFISIISNIYDKMGTW